MTIRNSSRGSNRFNTNSPTGLFVFGAIWTAFSCGMLFLVVGTEFSIMPVLFMSLFILVGLGLMAYSGMVFYTRFKVGKPDFILSQTEAIPGDQITLHFSHTFRSSVNINWMKTQLIFRETATYRRGTDTTTVTHNHVIDEYEEPGRNFQGGHMLSQVYTFDIPEDGMHTLKVRRNSLEWFIKYEADISSLPNFIEEIEITVHPESREG
jgi:hypothetical protein